jgi:hypothetical protein
MTTEPSSHAKTNLIAEQLENDIDDLAITSEDVKVVFCLEDCGRTAAVDCTSCISSFCDSCFKETHKSTALRNHTSVPVGNGLNRCPKHKDQLEDLVCINCDEKICVKCTFTKEHRGHSAVFIDEYAQNCKMDLNEMSHEFTDFLESSQTRYEEERKKRHKLDSMYAQTRKQIISEWERFIFMAIECKHRILKQFAEHEGEKGKSCQHTYLY